jgi:outer membrane biosynthesis protein TonB
MTIFPYVYPDIESDTFKYQANVIVGLFLSILYLSMILVAARAIKQLRKKPKNQPIFKETETPPKSETENLRDKWMEEPEANKPKKAEEEKKIEQLAVEESKGPQPAINEKGGLETEEDEDSDEEEEEETESEIESDDSTDKEGDAEEYSNLRRIPQADVNLADTGIGFSTGMSALREARIQQYRDKEKNM